MSASHKKRLARLAAALEEREEDAFRERCMRRFEPGVCARIRMAMEWRGIDPASSLALLDTEARVVRFVDTPELQAADAAALTVNRERALAMGDDPWSELSDEVDRLEQGYLDGSRPDFADASLMEFWAWALIQPRLLPAIPYDRYGRSDRTS
jgi:hypothetical protein